MCGKWYDMGCGTRGIASGSGVGVRYLRCEGVALRSSLGVRNKGWLVGRLLVAMVGEGGRVFEILSIM